ncbi:hypothetical protein H9P43_000635 [Blastocladiella emersonii ATCC 22665]|nr:hypothetical protein H9P43_000635 [Blastocladiella emersonii ATCC 22665]
MDVFRLTTALNSAASSPATSPTSPTTPSRGFVASLLFGAGPASGPSAVAPASTTTTPALTKRIPNPAPSAEATAAAVQDAAAARPRSPVNFRVASCEGSAEIPATKAATAPAAPARAPRPAVAMPMMRKLW